MRSSTKFSGYWWLPNNPDCKWLGQLRWQAGGLAKVRLQYESAQEETGPPLSETESFLGLDEKGTPISALKVGFSGGSRLGFLSSRWYTAGHVLKGIHVTSRDGFRVHRFNLWMQFLGDWLHEEGFTETNDGNFNVRYSRPYDRCFSVANGVTIRVCHAAKSKAQARQRKVGYDIFFAMEKARAFSWKQASRHIEGLRSLLHFATLKRVRLTALTFENLEHTFELAGKRYAKTIEVFNGSIAQPRKRDSHEQDFVFTFHDVEDRFGTLCAEWFEFCVQQKEALACYFPTVYFSLPDSLRLISITQALEAYHQRFFRPKVDVRFKDRIRELCNICATHIEQLVGDLEIFATVVTNSRDYYTHHHPSIRSKGAVATGVRLTLLTYHLQFLFRLCVLTQFRLDRDRFRVLLRQVPDIVVEY